ncbi:hypothetical protein GOODEAATRI_009778 [Goodea atripinnis]|uniref:Uncharacterized protein n=1 Tax=Goodea atripinnis TaxID=208336 RepID=A0ABV0PM95_9TELE
MSMFISVQMVTTQQVTAQDMDIIRIHGWISKNLLNPLKYWTTSENRLLISFRSTTSVSGLWFSLLSDPDTCSSHHPLLHRMQKVMVRDCFLLRLFLILSGAEGPRRIQHSDSHGSSSSFQVPQLEVSVIQQIPESNASECEEAVLVLAAVIGCRLRLHIDGYSECYDFWVNADSADIKPAGWCKEHNHKLHPPKGQSETEFDWQDHLQSSGYHAAPPTLFTCRSTDCEFQVGMKLEAVDKKNPGLVCVASVADVIDNRFLVHFDNWDDTYDYWCDSSSPYIHPVGWCEEQGRPLTAPQGHPSPENFVWEDYLQETGSTAAPSLAFTLIHYDGWSTQFDVWLDSDHCDLHPVGWCQRTGHPLEPPPVSPAAESSLQAALHQSVFLSAMSAQPGRDLSLCWEQHRKLLPGVARIHADAVQCWSVQQVSNTMHASLSLC